MEILIISGKRKSGLRDCLSGLKKKGLDYFSLTLNTLNALISSGYRKKEELIEEVYGLLSGILLDGYDPSKNYSSLADYVNALSLFYGIIEVPLLQKLYNRDFKDNQIKDRGEFLEHVRRITAFFPEAILSGPYLVYSWILNKADYRTILNEQQTFSRFFLRINAACHPQGKAPCKLYA